MIGSPVGLLSRESWVTRGGATKVTLREPVDRGLAPRKSVRLEAPRLARVARWWVAGSGRNLSAGPVSNIVRPLAAYERLRLLPDPQQLADFCDQAGHTSECTPFRIRFSTSRFVRAY